MKKVFQISLALLCLSFIATSCKPKQSAYKSVYEAAKEREMQETSSSESNTVVKSAGTLSPVEVSVRKEKVTPVYNSDEAGLKSFNVVVASLSVKLNAESLKTRMENEGYEVILAQNEQSMYRVIVASFDNKEDAVQKRNDIYEKYSAKGDTDFLRRTYGVPFNDLWILQREY